MDPVAHTLFGAALAETGLKRASRYATATLLIGANLPDIDVVASFWGSDASLYFRRGWSHGVLAMLVLPLLLAAAIWLWHRWRGQRNGSAPPFRPGAILGLSYLAVLSHPFLDWLNTYGVRLLMPFDDRWFYGDTLFIIDPWVWLLAAAGVVLARSGSYSAIAGWTLLAALATALVLTTDLVPPAVKLLWLLGLAIIIGLRWRRPSRRFTELVARTSFATLVIYVCAVYGIARVAESTIAAQHPAPLAAQANPVPGLPFSQRMVLVYPDSYRVVGAGGELLYEVPRLEPDAIVRAALQQESIRGFVNWMRHPYWEVEARDDGWVVSIWDLRYADPGAPPVGIGFVQVTVLEAEIADAPERER